MADTREVAPNATFRIGVHYTITPEWHIYGPERTEIGLPTKIDFKLPDGFTVGPLQYPKTTRFNDFGLVSFGYEKEVLIFATVKSPATLQPGAAISVEATTSYLACKVDGQCVPGRNVLSLELPVGTPAPSQHEPLFAKYAAQVPPASAPATQQKTTSPTLSGETSSAVFSFQKEMTDSQPRSVNRILLFAFLGGLILNVMPCVLPVLSLKVLSFVQQAGEQRARTFALGLVFALGVLVSFAVLATIVVVLQRAGGELGWGFQFREPRFLVFMSAILLAFSLSLFGVYGINLPGAAMQGAYALQSREGPARSFFNGVLATALATPCTAPLLGPALGYAFTQPATMIYVFFLTIGAGLAFPYVMLAAFPQWLAFLPKPGRWMETFKEFMGFLLLATVVWLMWLFGQTAGGGDAIIVLAAFLLCVGFGFWVIGRGFGPLSSRARRRATFVLAAIVLVGSYLWFPERYLRRSVEQRAVQQVATEDDGLWESFSVERVEELVAQKRAVFVDFTADWCLTCKVNEKAVLSQPSVLQSFKDNNVALLKADYTHQPPELTRIIRSFGRAGVPLYLVFPAGSKTPTVLPEALTPSMVINSLQG